MKWTSFLRKEELELYEHVRLSLVQGVSTFLWLQFFAYSMCSFLFFNLLSLKTHLAFAISLLLITFVISQHNIYGRKKKLWADQHHPSQAVYFTLFYLAVGYILICPRINGQFKLLILS